MDKHFRKTSITPRANAGYLCISAQVRNTPLTPLTCPPPSPEPGLIVPKPLFRSMVFISRPIDLLTPNHSKPVPQP